MRVGEKYKFVDSDINDGRCDLPIDIQLVRYVPNTGVLGDVKKTFTCNEGRDGYFVKYWYEQDGEIKTTYIAHYDNDKRHKCEMVITRQDILDNYELVRES